MRCLLRETPESEKAYLCAFLAVTNLYPTPRNPTVGTFVEQQIGGLKQIGLEVDLMLVNRTERDMGSYFTMGPRDRRFESISDSSSLMCFMSCTVVFLAERVTSMVTERPVLVSFCWSDLLGERLSGVLRRIVSECGILASHGRLA